MYPNRDSIKKIQRQQWMNKTAIVACTLLMSHSLYNGLWPIAAIQAVMVLTCLWAHWANKRTIAIHKNLDRKFIQYFCENFSGCLSVEELKMMRVLEMWVISERPSDFPTKFVARKFEVTNVPKPTDETKVADTLEEVRGMLPPGLFCLARDPADEPQIVETWL